MTAMTSQPNAPSPSLTRPRVASRDRPGDWDGHVCPANHAQRSTPARWLQGTSAELVRSPFPSFCRPLKLAGIDIIAVIVPEASESSTLSAGMRPASARAPDITQQICTHSMKEQP